MSNESSFGKIGYEEVGMKRKVFLNFYKFSVTELDQVAVEDGFLEFFQKVLSD